MKSKYIALPAMVLASVSLVAGPAFADEDEAKIEDETEECTTPETPEGLVASAEDAVQAAEDLESEGPCVDETGRERAKVSFQATIDRLEAKTEFNGFAIDVLYALMNDKSPSEIGKQHGADMAAAAAERRAERQLEAKDGSESPGKSASAGRPDNPGKSGDADKSEDEPEIENDNDDD